jgi:hypothetical protein
MDKMAEVNKFISNLHNGVYIIDPKANVIRYDDTMSLAGALAGALQQYEQAQALSVSPNLAALILAHNMITAAFTHSVVIDQNDTRRILRQTEELLKHCEEDKGRLEKDNNELRQELIRCEKVRKSLEELLSEKEGEPTSV